MGFYDTCVLPGYDEFRSVINKWLAEMPEKDRQELMCAEHERQLGGGSPLSSLMAVKG